MTSMPQQIQNALNALLEAGKITKEQLAAILQAASDPEMRDRILNELISAGADQIGSGPPLNIADYYREGTGNFEAKWPIEVSLPCSFEVLDRKTRFFVLFQEWTRRELQGSAAMSQGDTASATAIYEECLARSRQLEVNELVARSYEGLMRVANKLNDLGAARRYSQEAVKARSANG
jgi:tetratricopeptide (TPR) repeat protein